RLRGIIVEADSSGPQQRKIALGAGPAGGGLDEAPLQAVDAVQIAFDPLERRLLAYERIRRRLQGGIRRGFVLGRRLLGDHGHHRQRHNHQGGKRYGRSAEEKDHEGELLRGRAETVARLRKGGYWLELLKEPRKLSP